MNRRAFLKTVAAAPLVAVLPALPEYEYRIYGGLAGGGKSAWGSAIAESMRETKEVVCSRVLNASFSDIIGPGLVKVFEDSYANYPA